MGKIILYLLFLIILVLTFIKLKYYLQGYGWSEWRLSLRNVFSPFYGLVIPKQTTNAQRIYLLLEVIFGFFVGILGLVLINL